MIQRGNRTTKKQIKMAQVHLQEYRKHIAGVSTTKSIVYHRNSHAKCQEYQATTLEDIPYIKLSKIVSITKNTNSIPFYFLFYLSYYRVWRVSSISTSFWLMQWQVGLNVLLLQQKLLLKVAITQNWVYKRLNYKQTPNNNIHVYNRTCLWSINRVAISRDGHSNQILILTNKLI